MRYLRARKEQPEGYRRLSGNAMLAAALLTVTRLCERYEISDPELDELFDHLWRWPTINSATFVEWHSFHNPVLGFALGDPAPTELARAWQAVGVSDDELRQLLESLVEVVYGNLYASFQKEETLAHLRGVEAIACRHDVPIPSYTLFEGRRGASPSIHGWGDKMTTAEVVSWRSLDW